MSRPLYRRPRALLALLLLAPLLALAACADDGAGNSLLPDAGGDTTADGSGAIDSGGDDASDADDAGDAGDVGDAGDAADADAADATADLDASPSDTGDTAVDGSGAADTTPDDADDATDPGADVIPDASPDAPTDAAADADGIDDGAVPTAFVPREVGVDARFELDVQAGAMRPDGFLAWTWMRTRASVVLRVWRDSRDPAQVLLAYDEVVEPNADGYVHAPVTGLAGGVWYQYAFFVRDGEGTLVGRSAIGRVRTAFDPGVVEPLTIAVTSCTSFSTAPWEALEAMAEEPIDIFLHTGDQSYNDGARTIAEFREKWFRTLGDPGYRALHRAVGFYATWDDHEIDDNFNPEREPDLVAVGRQAYLETLAVESDEAGRIWRSYVWGDTAEVFVVDSRSERIPSTRGRDDVYISRAQMDWLKAGLAASTARFKLVLNSVPITDMPTLYVGTDDRWEGYPAQRRELLDWITGEDIRDVWFLSGDFHIGMVTRVDNSGPARRMLEIAAGPGGNSNPVASALGTLESLAGVDQIIYHTRSTENEVGTVLELDPAEGTIRVRFFEPDGTVLYDEVHREGD